jgi:glucokinase
MILAGDIGGTSARLGCYETRGGRLVSVVERTFPSRNYAGLAEIAAEFVSSAGLRTDCACFGIAGPVQHGRVVTPNLPWVLDSRQLAAELKLPWVKLINDLEANAYGLAALEPADLVVLNEGDPAASGNLAVISVGTGLGEAGLFWDGLTHRPFACEGGHSDFAPRTIVESELLLYLKARHEHVSYERVLSGPGLLTIYEFLRDTGRGTEARWLRDEMDAGDAPAAISAAGLEAKDELCAQALNLFVSFYAAEAGNLALKLMATGGVYIGGGVAPRIVKKLQTPEFLAAFFAKGRMRPLLEAMPVKVVMKDTAALLGAARCATLIQAA